MKRPKLKRDETILFRNDRGVIVGTCERNADERVYRWRTHLAMQSVPPRGQVGTAKSVDEAEGAVIIALQEHAARASEEAQRKTWKVTA